MFIKRDTCPYSPCECIFIMKYDSRYLALSSYCDTYMIFLPVDFMNIVYWQTPISCALC